MGNEKFQDRYRIPSARASWHAYDDGAYFVTICTAHREHYFGEITGGEMRLTEIGQFVANNLQTVSAHYHYAEIPLFVVMPNHLHAIVYIDGNKIPSTRRNVADNIDSAGRDAADNIDVTRTDAADNIDVIRTDAADNIDVTRTDAADNIDVIRTDAADNIDVIRTDAARHVSTQGKNAKMQEIANQSGWLSVCIGGIKSSVTKYAHENNTDFGWQSRFHDHIIRDANEMNRITNYIKNNVAKWESDCFYNNL